jgi:predicted nucleotidyltransferase component of viral defense system
VTPPANTSTRVYTALQKLARSEGRPTQELLQFYVLEAFLDRITRSGYNENLVLKGGVLLAVFGERRPTRDIDLQAQGLSNDLDVVQAMIEAVANVTIDDGVTFDIGSAHADVIRDDDAYAGVRVTLTARLATAKISLHVDVSVGDPISPAPEPISLPRLLGGEVVVRGYPLVMVHAEKIVTAIERGTTNTRWRDFVDIYTLSGHHPIDGTTLADSIKRVAIHRSATLASLAVVLDGYGPIAQAKWAAWRAKQQLEQRVPESFQTLIDTVAAFADPAINETATEQTWRPMTREWT